MATRELIKGITGFKSVNNILRQKNFGLAESFRSGISQILSIYDRAIILEDDNLVSRSFLHFMNSNLAKYEFDDRIFSITGYSWPIFPKAKKPYFVKGAETWSVGIWKRSWDLMNLSANELLFRINQGNLKKEINKYGNNFYKMLESASKLEIDSWGVLFWATAVLEGRLCLYPHKPLCINIGNDNESTHTSNGNALFVDKSTLYDSKIITNHLEVKESKFMAYLIRINNFFLILKFFIRKKNFC